MAVLNAIYTYPQYFTVFLDTSITRTYTVRWDSMAFGAPLPFNPHIQPIYFSSQFGSFDIGATRVDTGSHFENHIPTQITSLSSYEFPGSYSISGIAIPRVSSSSGFTVTVSLPTLLTGNDSITGGAANDKLYGFGGNDYISGGDGDDYINGGTGADVMVGGSGNDTFIVDHIEDAIQEAFGGGVDTVIVGPMFFGFNIADKPGVENVTLSGSFDSSVMGNSADNVLVGNAAVNTLSGLGGNDTLDGRTGADTLIGGTGDDTYVVDNALDVVTENANEGSDTVNSSLSFSLVSRPDVENVTLLGAGAINATGNARNNLLIGNTGANVLDGGPGADALAGGAGNDTYIVDDEGDAVMEISAIGGIDTVRSSVSFVLGTLTENLVLTGAADVNGTGKPGVNRLEGNVADNILTGMGGNDVLIGNAGDDTLDGGTGADNMIGGSGDDVYVVDIANDLVTELANAGTDEVRSSISYLLGTNLENLTLTGSNNPNATGNALANVLIGNSGNNTLNGGLGADTMRGGAGDDTFIIDNPDDNVVEVDGEGVDTVRTIFTTDISARQELENITLLGIAALNATGNSANNVLAGNGAANILTGNDGNDTLIGGAGADTLIGGLGDDIYVLDNILDVVNEIGGDGDDTVNSTFSFDISGRPELENITLLGTANFKATGNSKSNALTGNVAANTLDGGAGADIMVGGLGSDTYIVDDSGDTATESSASGGIDVVKSSVGFVLGVNIENLILAGTGAIDGTGNASANRLEGNANANVLTGLAGNDILIGAAGNDTLDGGTGNDAMAGGLGDDIYHVDATGDITTEGPNAGLDLVYSSASRALAANVENLTLNGSGNINATGNSLANVLIGNNGNNILDGGPGPDFMAGGSGNDTYVIDNAGDSVTENPGEGNDTIRTVFSLDISDRPELENVTLLGAAGTIGTGNALDNILVGNAGNNGLTGNEGNDTLDGRAGTDTMSGGAGDDLYFVDNVQDAVIENVDEGTDTVRSVIGYSLATRPNLENVTLLGVLAANATGNASDNVLIGNTATNILAGELGNDTLDGGLGADRMVGGAGDDTYFVDNPADVVVEVPDHGEDRVFSFVSYTLAANVENLTQLGSANLNAIGNALGNRITGNLGNNVLNGGLGADILAGSQGNDTYVVDNSGDVVVENPGAGADTVQASVDYTLNANVENLTLTGAGTTFGSGNELDNVVIGNAAANTLNGGAGNDILNGGAGNDTLIGGSGDDSFVFDTGDILVEEVEGGTDTVISSMTFALAENFENLILTGASAINGTGNAADNVLTGNAAKNVLVGGEGNDTLNGAAGADTMAGGLGDDIYFVDNSLDVVTENPGEGIDTIRSSISYSLAMRPNLENVALLGTLAINATGNDLENDLTGNSAANVLNGGNGSDTLNGGAGNDILLGGGGADFLDGGPGNDSMSGGTEDDTYIVSAAGDVITEVSGAGNDTVRSAVTYILGSSNTIENLVLTGLASINGTGNALDNFIYGNDGQNVLDGGSSGNDTLNGGGGSDTLVGGVGDDILDGGSGDDEMSGGSGNDTYFVDSPDDLIIETSLGGDSDLVNASCNYVLLDWVENVTLLGNANIGANGNSQDNVLTGNVGDNRLDGGVGADRMVGGAGDDTYVIDNEKDVAIETPGNGYDTLEARINIHAATSSSLPAEIEKLVLIDMPGVVLGDGNGLNNEIVANGNGCSLSGYAGNDILIGGNGADYFDYFVAAMYGGDDTMIGGLGDDIYYVEGMNNTIVELPGEGIDKIVMVEVADFVLPDNVEILNLTYGGTGKGNALDNEIYGTILYGEDGDDSLYFNGYGNISGKLYGGSGNDQLFGGQGGNFLDGGAGSDVLDGGLGNDIFIFDADDTSVRGGGGLDTLKFAGAGEVLDLTNTPNDIFRNIQIVDLTGTGDNALVFTLQDVMAISTISGQLRIDGNVGDAATSTAQGWIPGADVSVDDNLYHTYTFGSANLYVDTDLTLLIN